MDQDRKAEDFALTDAVKAVLTAYVKVVSRRTLSNKYCTRFSSLIFLSKRNFFL